MKKYKVLKDFYNLKKGDILKFMGTKLLLDENEKGTKDWYGINKIDQNKIGQHIELREDYIQECGRDWFEEIYQDKK